MSRPTDMAAAIWAIISKLPSDTRDRALERAAVLIFEAGLPPETADERALAEEAGVYTQRRLGGVR